MQRESWFAEVVSNSKLETYLRTAAQSLGLQITDLGWRSDCNLYIEVFGGALRLVKQLARKIAEDTKWDIGQIHHSSELSGSYDEKDPYHEITLVLPGIPVKRRSGTVYHLTTTSNLDRILKEGLKPNLPTSLSHSKKIPPAIYLAGDLQSVQSVMDDFQRGYEDHRKGEFILLTLELPKNIPLYKDCEYGDDSLSMLYTTSPIPPEAIKKWTRYTKAGNEGGENS